METRVLSKGSQVVLDIDARLDRLERREPIATDSTQGAKEALSLSRETKRQVDSLELELEDLRSRHHQQSVRTPGDDRRMQDMCTRIESRVAASDAQMNEL
eukprot:scaffold124056_cov47-Prasinocladus_malaysianus.AAC.1